MNKVVIGIDQSYNDCGISVALNGKIKAIKHLKFESQNSHSDKRKVLDIYLHNLINNIYQMTSDLTEVTIEIIIERIRLHSAGFLSIDYIKSIGALNAKIVDVANEYNIKVYSVDTRAWKSKVVGTSKPKENKYNVDPKKWPTIEYVCKLGYAKKLLELSKTQKQTKKNFKAKDGKYYSFNDNTADSVCICLYGFVKGATLKEEH